MDEPDADRKYPEVVAFAVSHLMHLHKEKAAVTPAEVEHAVAMAQVLYPDILDERRLAWLRQDTAALLEKWDVLHEKQNRRRIEEIVRGALR